MKRYFFIILCLLIFSFNSINAKKTKIDCFQVWQNTFEKAKEMGFTGADAEQIADGAYSGCEEP